MPAVTLPLLMVVLGLLPLFNGGYSHPIVYGASMVAGIAAAVRPRVRLGLAGDRVGGTAQLIPGGLFLLLFIAWAALGVTWSIDRHQSLVALNELLLGGLILLLVAATLDTAGVEKLLGFLLLTGTAVALVGLSLFVFIASTRITATFVNPNHLGTYLAMLVAAAVFWYHQSRSRWLAAAVIILGAALVLTGSRGAWLALAVGLAVAWAGTPAEQRRPLLKTFLVMGLAVAAITLLTVVGASFIQEQASTWLEATAWGRWLMDAAIARPASMATTSAPGRLSFWGVAWRMAADHPVGGVGLGNYHTAYFEYWPGDRYYSRFAHNYYLQTAAETGWIGCALLLAFLVIFFWNCWKRRTHDFLYLGLLAAALAFLAHSFIEFSWNAVAVAGVFWAMAGMLAASWRGNARGGEMHVPGLGAETEGAAVAAAEMIRPAQGDSREGWEDRGHREPGRSSRQKGWLVAVIGVAAVWLAFTAGLFWLGESLAGQSREAVAAGETELGIARAQLAVYLVPVAAAARADLAWAYWEAASKTNREDLRRQARSEMARAVQLSPDNYAINLQMGQMLLAREEDYPQAEFFLRRAAACGGYVPSPYAALGYLYLRQERYPEAEGVLRQGLQMVALARVNAPTAAEQERLIAIEAQMHLTLARVYAELGNSVGSREQLAAARQLYPEIEVGGSRP